MKKITNLLIYIFVLTTVFSASVFAASDVTVYVDKEFTQLTDAYGNPVYPFIKNGTTYIPVRGISQVLGCIVEWDGDNENVLIYKDIEPDVKHFRNDSGNIKLYLDNVEQTLYDANGQEVNPFEKNGTTYVPLRGVSKVLGYPVDWEGSTKSVYVWKDLVPPLGVTMDFLKPYEDGYYDDDYSYFDYDDADEDNYPYEAYITDVVTDVRNGNVSLKYGSSSELNDALKIQNDYTGSLTIDGIPLDIDSLTEGDVISFYIDDDNKTYDIFICRETVEGTIEDSEFYYDEQPYGYYIVDGEGYCPANISGYDEYETIFEIGLNGIEIGDFVKFYIDAFGQIALCEREYESFEKEASVEQNYYKIIKEYIDAYEMCTAPDPESIGTIYGMHPYVNWEYTVNMHSNPTDERYKPKYFLKDIDNDKIAELFIGNEIVFTDNHKNQRIHGVFTYKDGEIVNLFGDVGNRMNAYLLDDNTIWYEMSSNYQNFICSNYYLSGTEYIATETLKTEDSNIWYHNGSVISKDEANKLLKEKRDKIIEFEWNDIYDFEQSVCEKNFDSEKLQNETPIRYAESTHITQ